MKTHPRPLIEMDLGEESLRPMSHSPATQNSKNDTRNKTNQKIGRSDPIHLTLKGKVKEGVGHSSDREREREMQTASPSWMKSLTTPDS